MPRVRFFKEDPIFDAFTRFDTSTGRSKAVDEDGFVSALAVARCRISRTLKGIDRYDAENHTVFLGETCATRTRFPRRIYFQITRNCNLECSYCFLKARHGLPHVPTDAAIEMAAFLSYNGLMEVRLTGGEPTTHPDFLRILDAFRDNDVYVSVATNGMVSRRTLDSLAERRHLWIICSVDGNRKTHNAYRPDTFDQILANLQYLKRKSPDTRLRLTMTLTKWNQRQIRNIGEIAKTVDAESVTIIPLRPQVRETAVQADMLTANEFRSVLEQMVKVNDELGVQMTTTLGTDLEFRLYPDPIVRKRGACAAGREAANLDYDGEKGTFMMYGCSYSPASDIHALPAIRRPFLAGEFPLGHCDDFQKIWEDDSAWAIYRNPSFKASQCHACDYYVRHQCVGSCPIQNVDYGLIDAGTDVLYQLEAQLSRTAEWYCYKRIRS
jgi:MoaA/NifB/PqqE/SkfB family radical SAM enzyme